MGITYGQLYRWKRQGLIPEEWFIKRSSVTGQETYFEEDKILPRITWIKQNKDIYSFEVMAKMLNEEESLSSKENFQLLIDNEVQEKYQQLSTKKDLNQQDYIILYALFNEMKKYIEFTKIEALLEENIDYFVHKCTLSDVWHCYDDTKLIFVVGDIKYMTSTLHKKCTISLEKCISMMRIAVTQLEMGKL